VRRRVYLCLCIRSRPNSAGSIGELIITPGGALPLSGMPDMGEETQVAATARWSQMLSFILSMGDGHLRVTSTSDTRSMPSSSRCLTSGLRNADHGEVRVILDGLPPRGASLCGRSVAGYRRAARQSRVGYGRPYRRPHAHRDAAGRRDRCGRVGRGGLCSVALLAAHGFGLVRTMLGVVNRPQIMGVGQDRVHISWVSVGVDD
jgi:hypothetical protein